MTRIDWAPVVVRAAEIVRSYDTPVTLPGKATDSRTKGFEERHGRALYRSRSTRSTRKTYAACTRGRSSSGTTRNGVPRRAGG